MLKRLGADGHYTTFAKTKLRGSAVFIVFAVFIDMEAALC